MQGKDNDTERLFDLYESNSKNFQKAFGILVGVGLFFLLTAIFPYFLNIFDQQEKKMQIKHENSTIQKANSDIASLTPEIRNITNEIKTVSDNAHNTTSKVNDEIKAVNALLPKKDSLPIIAGNNTEALSKLKNLLNNVTYQQNATIKFASEAMKTDNEAISSYYKRNSSLSHNLAMAISNKTSSQKRLIEATNATKIDSAKLVNLTKRWEEIQSPFGNFPIDFTNLLAIFPISLAGGFLVCSVLLSQSIHLRRAIHHNYAKKKGSGDNVKDKDIHLFAPLWIDPVNVEQNKFLQFLILLIPFIIFLLSVTMIIYSWQYAPSEPFAAANNLSKNIYYSLYAFDIGIFIFSYWRIINEVRYYYYKLLRH